MKNHELLDMIGDVNEDYVLEAGNNVAKPRFNWKPLAACAACAALALCVYRAWRAAQPYEPLLSYESDCAPEASQDPTRALIQTPGLHDYILVEQDVNILTTQGGGKAHTSGGEPAPDPGLEPPRGSGPTEAGADADSDAGGGGMLKATASPSGQDEAAVQEEASAQYERLLQHLGLWGIDGRGLYPDWYGGVWLAGEYLTVAIVDGFRTPELEAQIVEWCGGTEEVLFTGAKYSQNYLDSLMDRIARIFEEQDVRISSTYGVYVMDNYLGLDFFGEVPSDETLSALAELDPDGDAIRIQVFYDGHLSPTAQSEKAPSCDPGEYDPSGEQAEPAMDPVDPEAFPTPTPIDGSDDPADTVNAGDLPAQPSTTPAGSMPSGARAVDDLSEKKRDTYDALKEADAQGKAHYDLITEGE